MGDVFLHTSSQLPPSTEMTTPTLSLCPSSVFCPAHLSHLLGRKLDQGTGFSHFSAVLTVINAYNRSWHIVGTQYLLKEQRRAIVYLFKKDLFYHLGVFLFYIFYKYECLACMCNCVLHIYLVPSKARRGMSGPQELGCIWL